MTDQLDMSARAIFARLDAARPETESPEPGPGTISRRALIGGGGVAAAGLTLPGWLTGGSAPKAAVPLADVSGLPVINITSAPFYADPTGNSDSTAAIVAAIATAGKTGRIYAPQGVYLITGANNHGGPIAVGGNGLFEGAGSTWLANPATVFKCGDSSAGLVFTGNGMVANFTVDGNDVATTPLQRGTELVGGAYGTFMNVAVINSAQDGWTIISAQNDSYYNCVSHGSARDNLYFDGGTGGHDFYHWNDSVCGRYGIRSDALTAGILGTYGFTVEGIRFWGGITESGAYNQNQPVLTPTGVSRVFLKHAVDWSFPYMNIVGIQSKGPTIAIDQSTCYDIDLSNTRIWANVTSGGASPGYPGVAISGAASYGGEYFFDNAYFVAGDTSIYVANATPFLTAGGMLDHTTNGPVAASGVPDINTLLLHRTGTWVATPLNTGWTGNVAYRASGFGRTEFKGSMAGPDQTVAFVLPVGYRPLADAKLVALAGSGFGALTIAAGSGAVTPSQGTGQAASGISLDGLSITTS